MPVPNALVVPFAGTLAGPARGVRWLNWPCGQNPGRNPEGRQRASSARDDGASANRVHVAGPALLPAPVPEPGPVREGARPEKALDVAMYANLRRLWMRGLRCDWCCLCRRERGGAVARRVWSACRATPRGELTQVRLDSARWRWRSMPTYLARRCRYSCSRLISFSSILFSAGQRRKRTERRSSRVSRARRSPSRPSTDTSLGSCLIMSRALPRRRPRSPRLLAAPIRSSRCQFS